MIKNIEKVPTQSYFNAHYFCDYIELLSLINNNDLLSVSDIYDRFLEDDKINIPDNNSDIELGSNASEIADNWENRIKEWFDILKIRQQSFSVFYPFDVRQYTVKLKKSLNIKQKLYLFLLLNSTQKYISQNVKLLTSDFEDFSLEALKRFMPSNASCYRFGKSMLDYDRYKGHIKTKIDLLASDLNYPIKHQAHFFATKDNGDKGLDLVAWTSFQKDINQNNMQVYLCQCATGAQNWLDKQYEPKKFIKYIDFKSQVNIALFIPFDSRNFDRKFSEDAEIFEDILLFDRIRLLYLLGNNKNLVKKLKSFKIVNQIIEFEEDII